MENSKSILSEEKRKSKSKDVMIQFIDETFTKFNVLNEEGNIKYFGLLKSETPHEEDSCSCPSFTFGMQYDKIENEYKGESNYLREHGYSFSCKHILKARMIRYGSEV